MLKNSLRKIPFRYIDCIASIWLGIKIWNEKVPTMPTWPWLWVTYFFCWKKFKKLRWSNFIVVFLCVKSHSEVNVLLSYSRSLVSDGLTCSFFSAQRCKNNSIFNFLTFNKLNHISTSWEKVDESAFFCKISTQFCNK